MEDGTAPESADGAEGGEGAEPRERVDLRVGADEDLAASVPSADEEDAEPSPAPARRGPCAQDLRSRPVGPLQVGELDGNLGVAHRACPRHEVAIGGDALLVADEANFYGNIRVNGRARISAPVFDPRVEGFLSWEAFRYQTVLSSVGAEYVGLGYLSWGARGQVYLDDERVVAVTGRMVLPTTTGLDQGGQPLALDVGVTAAHQVDPNFRVHMWLNLLGSIGLGGPVEPKGGLRIGGGVDWRPFEWLAFVLELQTGFFYRDTLDLMAAQAGVRLALGSEVGLEVAASIPFLGVRSLADGGTPIAASLMLSWYFR